MDYQTAAAMSQNLAGIGDMFMQMNDPAARAKAQLVGNQNALLGAQTDFERTRNSLLPGSTASENAMRAAQAGHAMASAGYETSRADNERLKNLSGRTLFDSLNAQAAPGSPALSAGSPFTTYSTGSAVGGPDESQDRNTNMGLSSTGKNLFEGGVAVNPDKYPLGTVFRNGRDGQVYIATDTHGNKDPNVIDFYSDPQNYRAASGRVDMQVLGRETIPYGTTVDQLNAMRSKYTGTQPQAVPIDAAEQVAVRRAMLARQAGLASIFSGNGGNDFMMGQARGSALTAQTEAEGRQAGLAITGNGMTNGENFTPQASDAFQARDLANKVAVAEGNNQTDQNIAAANIIAGGGHAGSAGSAAAGGPGKFDGFDGTKEIEGKMAARFGTLGSGGGTEPDTISDADRPAAQNWASSVAVLVNSGVPFEAAASIADEHHGLPKRDAGGWFSSASNSYAKPNVVPITQAQAAQVASQYARDPAVGGLSEARIAAAATLNPSLAQAFGYAGDPGPAIGGPQAPATAQQSAPAATVQPSPAPSKQRLTGTPLGTAKKAEEDRAGRDYGTDYNAATLGNAIRAAQQEGVSMQDMIATAMSPSSANEWELGKIFATSKGRGVIQGGGTSAQDLRNALMDTRALQRANIDPQSVLPYIQQSPPSPPPAGGVRKYNPATGKIE